MTTPDARPVDEDERQCPQCGDPLHGGYCSDSPECDCDYVGAGVVYALYEDDEYNGRIPGR